MTELSRSSSDSRSHQDLDALLSDNSSCAGLFSAHDGMRTNVCKTSKIDEPQAGHIVFTPANLNGAKADEVTPSAKIVPAEKVSKPAESARAAVIPERNTTGSAAPIEARLAPAPQITDPSGFDPRIAMKGASDLYGANFDLGVVPKKDIAPKVGIDNVSAFAPQGAAESPIAAPAVMTGPADGQADIKVARGDRPQLPRLEAADPEVTKEKPVVKAPAKVEKEPAHEPPVLPAEPMNPFTALFNIFTPSPYIAGQATPYDPINPPHAVPFGRPGETVPSRILYPNAWSKDYLNSVETAASRIYKETHGHTGDCGRGIREGANDMNRGFNMFSDTKSGDVNLRWRSAMQIGDYLYATGLFDKYPLEQMKHQLRDGFTVVRPWTDAVNNAEKWKTGGENKGDIAVVSHNGYQYNDHTEPFEFNNSRYDMKGSYVLVPKGYNFDKEPVMPVSDAPPEQAHGRGRGRGHGYSRGPAHEYHGPVRHRGRHR